MTEKRLNVENVEDLFVRNELIRLYEENKQLKKQNTFLTEQLAELSAYIMALGYDVELHFEDGRIINLNEEVVEDD